MAGLSVKYMSSVTFGKLYKVEQNKFGNRCLLKEVIVAMGENFDVINMRNNSCVRSKRFKYISY